MKLFLRLWEEFLKWSPPSRGAWIEMIPGWATSRGLGGRPPRGGRGLKSSWGSCRNRWGRVAPLAGGVD